MSKKKTNLVVLDANALVGRRIVLRLLQKDVARLTGISIATLRLIEKTGITNDKNLHKIAEALGVNSKQLLQQGVL